jgi:hypothetical protein
VQLDDLDALCGIVFVEQRFTAKILYHLLNVSRFLHWDLTCRCQYSYNRLEYVNCENC